MTGLVLKLGPRERILINGAVIENGDRRSRINIVTPNVRILRLRDAIHPDSVKTPVQRACYLAQLVLSGDASAEEMHDDLLNSIDTISDYLSDPESKTTIGRAVDFCQQKNYYQCLKNLRVLLSRETSF